MIEVKIPVGENSYVTGRNGDAYVGEVELRHYDGEPRMRLDFVSAKKGVRLNAGAGIDADAFDRIAEAWLRARGRL